MGWDPSTDKKPAGVLRWPVLWLLLSLAALPARGDGGGSSSAAVDLKLPADIVFSRAPGSDSAVVFSHQSHVEFSERHCLTCHPQLFPMLTRGPAPSHQEMNNRHSCGTCHDGKQAFGVQDAASCRNCHTGTGGAANGSAGTAAGGTAATPAGGSPARKVPAPHPYPSGDGSPGKVTFRHEPHVKSAGSCSTCHPKLFPMAAQPPRPNGGMHEPTACGACHNGTKSFGVEDTDSCTRCHIETGARP